MGAHLGRLAHFEDERPLEPVREPKSESRETTFPVDLHGMDALLGPLERLSRELRERQACAEPGAEVGLRGGRERGERRDPALLEARGGLRSDAEEYLRRVGGEALACLGSREAHETVGLVGVRGHLGHELVRPEADRAAEPSPLPHPGLEAPRGCLRALEVAQVEVGLVEADDPTVAISSPSRPMTSRERAR